MGVVAVPNCFKHEVFERPSGADKPDAVLVAAGAPLLDALVGAVIDRYGPVLQHGAVFVDATDTQPDRPMLIACVEQDITHCGI